jgi:nitrogenase molybdenum-iron protein alpha/beta subunit
MNRYLKSITPDSFSGAVFMLESIRRSVALINGPSGCKFYHSATSDSQCLYQAAYDPLSHPEQYFFGQPRVPCTYLDSSDYVYGSIEKLEGALQYLAETMPVDLISIVNSPGAALIGDDLKGVARRILPDRLCLTVESPGFSLDITDGFDRTGLALLKSLNLSPAPHKKTDTIYVLGLSIYHKYYRGDVEELNRILGLCGIKVGCFFGAGAGLEEIRRMPEAALNVVLHPEYAVETAAWLESETGVQTFVPDGPPVGFAETERFVRDILVRLEMAGSLSGNGRHAGNRSLDFGSGGNRSGDALSADKVMAASQAPISPSASRLRSFTEEAERSRATAFAYVSRVNSMTGLPKGTPFALEGYPFDVLAYSRFLTGYFGMVLDCALTPGPENCPGRKELAAYLSGVGMGSALDTDLSETNAQIVFGNGSTIASLRHEGKRFCGVEFALPTMGYLDVLPKTHLGLKGALLLTEQVLNGLLF